MFNLKAEALQAIAQPTRLKILECLRGGERCVCEIFPAIDEEQSNVSRHLAVLRKAGLVTSWKEGPKVIYKVKSPEIFKIIDAIGSIIKAQYKESEALVKQL